MLIWTKRLLWVLLLLIAILVLAATLLLRGSLPSLDGGMTLPGLTAAVTIQRDANGVVTIDAGSEADALRALGYVHAQERYFEMDLMRRTSAGELAELFGPVAIDLDKKRRVHRIRARVTEHLNDFAGEKMPQLMAYADGVNAGLDDLRTRPWPYLLLQQSPRRWDVVDSALTGYAMYFDLQDSENTRELALWKIRQIGPPALANLLAHDGTEWDAPMFGQPRGNAKLPALEHVDLRELPMPKSDTHRRLADKGTPGSNNWAVAGPLTKDGRATLANDMHLGLRAPNIWFRARLRYPDARAPGGKVDVSGVTLPGLPAVIVGSNGHVAWGFTNSYADTADWYPVRPCANEETAADTCDRVTRHAETIGVAGADAVPFEVVETAYGPILHERAGDIPALALRWTAHLPGALNFELADLASASDLGSALAVAERTAIPAQNLVIGDRNGEIAWRILGPLPVRSGRCARNPPLAAITSASADNTTAAFSSIRREACYQWSISTELSPVLRRPSQHRLWTANARVVDDAGLSALGDGGYALGARAKQIRDGLFAKNQFSEKELLDIQLDNRAVFLKRWWQLLQDQAKKKGDGTAVRALATAGRKWEGRASTDSVSFRLVRAWRLAVHARIADGLTAPAQAALGEEFVMPDLPQLEGTVWPLLQQRPAHLLSRRYPTWDALLEDAAKEVRDELIEHGPLEQRIWGERNTANICHPLTDALPGFLKSRLCMPAEPLPGDGAMPRVQGPAFGASERMVVSPGHEADGILHMPGGQSGHPLSPFWGAGHGDWVHGRPTPFLPQKTEYVLTLKP
ncbi:penicillin acylase family protein [Pseudoxanthomonas sp. UTMC 1351]|uniref:penicillin acylase family protein n=1 Tax=Pseudoxanthomonas sp. UTMC 1351 TaxID=2695853 RepID=UPI0034CED580